MNAEEINEKVARKMGHPNHRFQTNVNHIQPCGHPTCETPIPDYCHDIKAAWEIVELWNRSSTYWSLYKEMGGIHCWVGNKNAEAKDNILEIANTAPLAICFAFLKLP